MRVEQNGKTLYHIQNLEMGSDGQPFDTYIWCDHFPNKQDLRKAFDLEWGEDYDDREDAMREWLTSSEIYAVYAEEV